MISESRDEFGLLRLAEARSGARVCDPQPLRSAESGNDFGNRTRQRRWQLSRCDRIENREREKNSVFIVFSNLI
jgi:hypothetical protein